jgi:photosystem II stability/assembly factor-like uncharacterized protein
MKNLLKVLALILIVSFTACKKDSTATDSPVVVNSAEITLQGYTIQLLDFISADEGWIFVSENGQQYSYKLIHSTDGFANYTVINNSIPRFRKMKFIDNQIGYGISWDGSDKTYYTNDGGVTWQNFVIPAASQEGSESYDITYNDTYFVMPYKKENSSYDMVAGIRFFKRSDFSFDHKVLFDTEAGELYGGASGIDAYYSSVYVANSGHVCFTGIYKDDGSFGYEDTSYVANSTNGSTITLVEIVNKYHKPERTFFTSDSIGYYTMDDDANLYKTTNGGETWTSVYTFTDASKYKTISFSDNNNGAVLLGVSELYITNNGGITFESSSLNSELAEINQVVCVDNCIWISAIKLSGSIPEQKLIKITN